MEFSRQESGVGYHFLLQGIFPTQRLNPGLLCCRQILYHLSHQGSPYKCQSVYFILIIAIWSRCILFPLYRRGDLGISVAVPSQPSFPSPWPALYHLRGSSKVLKAKAVWSFRIFRRCKHLWRRALIWSGDTDFCHVSLCKHILLSFVPALLFLILKYFIFM